MHQSLGENITTCHQSGRTSRSDIEGDHQRITARSDLTVSVTTQRNDWPGDDCGFAAEAGPFR
jgi:hypothetical protein